MVCHKIIIKSSAGLSRIMRFCSHTNSFLRIACPVLMVLSIFLITPVSATMFLQNGSEVSGDQLIGVVASSENSSVTPFPLQFFYNTHCGSCQASLEYLNNFTRNNSDIQIAYHDLYNNSTNMTLYNQYKSRFDRNDIHYPVIFIGEIAIMGSDDIGSYTQPLVLWYQKEKKTDPIAGFISQIRSIIGKR